MATNGKSSGAPAINGRAYPIEDHSYDVVVVGAGGSGLRAVVRDLFRTPIAGSENVLGAICGYLIAGDETPLQVTGEVIGQVASQTLENIAAVDDNLPPITPVMAFGRVHQFAQLTV